MRLTLIKYGNITLTIITIHWAQSPLCLLLLVRLGGYIVNSLDILTDSSRNWPLFWSFPDRSLGFGGCCRRLEFEEFWYPLEKNQCGPLDLRDCILIQYDLRTRLWRIPTSRSPICWTVTCRTSISEDRYYKWTLWTLGRQTWSTQC